MKVTIDHEKLTKAADELVGLADRLENQASTAQQGTPIDLPSLDSSTMKQKVSWMRDQEPMLRGLAGIARLLDTDKNGVETFTVGNSVDDIKKMLGKTMAENADSMTPALLEKFLEEWGGFKPPTEDDPVLQSLFWIGQAQFGASSAASWLADGRYGMFRPINALGHTVSKNLGFWQRLKYGAGRFPTQKGLNWYQRIAGFKPKGHFSARPWNGANASKWSTAGKWLSRGGTALSFATSAYSEWGDSAKYPTDERIGRTVTKGATTAAGAWAGGQAGAWAGGAIGTAICPGVGTVIGAGVGGLIGGFAGSKAGEWVGDKAKDVGGAVGDAVGDGVDKAGEILDDITPW